MRGAFFPHILIGRNIFMSTIGIIGAGAIGSAVARILAAKGISVVIANSRGPQSLAELVQSLGEV
jgi:predicted dinucleotide-binding enzyme